MTESWKQMTLGQWKRLTHIPDDGEDRVFEMVAVLCDTTLDDIMNRPIQEVGGLTKKLNFLSEKKPMLRRVRSRYRLGETEYVFRMDPRSITVSQYIDYVNIPKDTDHMAELLSVFLIPEGSDKYNEGYNIEKVARDIDRYMLLEDANSLSAFFLSWYRISLARMGRMTRRALRRAVKDGAVTKEEADRTMETIGLLRRAISG